MPDPATVGSGIAASGRRLPPMSDRSDFNARIIEEFRANGGKVGGGFAGAPMLILHTIGARSGADVDHRSGRESGPDVRQRAHRRRACREGGGEAGGEIGAGCGIVLDMGAAVPQLRSVATGEARCRLSQRGWGVSGQHLVDECPVFRRQLRERRRQIIGDRQLRGDHGRVVVLEGLRVERLTREVHRRGRRRQAKIT